MTTDDRFRDAIVARKAAVAATGSSSGLDRLELQNEANDAGPIELVGRAVSSINAAANLHQWMERKMLPDDPNFDYEANKDTILAGVPGEYQYKFNGVQSLAEGMELRSDLLNQMRDLAVLNHAGAKGFGAMALAGIVDIDLPLMLLPGGTYLGAKGAMLAEKAGVVGRAGNAFRTGLAGAEAGLVTETVNSMVSPTGEWTDIPAAALGGLVFGTGLGALSKGEVAANKGMRLLREDFESSVVGGEAGRIDWQSQNVTHDTVFGEHSVGAAQTPGSKAAIVAPDHPDYDPELSQPRVIEMHDSAKQFLEDNEVDFLRENAFPDTHLGRAAKKFYEMLNKTLLASDSDVLLNSTSPIARALGFKLLESPAGIVRNNKSGAILNNMYFAHIAAPVNTNYGKFFDAWAGSKGSTEPRVMRPFNQGLRNQFDQEVMEELQYRYHDGVSNPNAHASVIEYANLIDQASERALKILQGQNGEVGVRGSEELTPEKGWFRQLWRGDKIQAIINTAPKGQRSKMRKAIENALAASYRKVHPGLSKELAEQYSKAVLRRAAAKERGIDTNLVRLLDQEGSDFVHQMLTDNGFTKAQADEFINGLKGVNFNKGKEGILKERKDIDLREPIPGTSLRLMDLVDTDIPSVWTRYARKAAGASAMARHGIQKADKQDIINAIMADQTASGGGKVTKEMLDAVFSYFDGGAYAGGINPWERRALQTTNLALLNGLGLTQLAETGVQVAAVGWEAFIKSAPKEVQDMLSGKSSEALHELKAWMAHIDGEQNVFMDHLMLDEMRNDPGVAVELGAFMDKLLVRGRHVQGYVSGFYHVKQLQQRVAVRSMLYRLAQHFQGSKEIGNARLADLGLSPEVERRIGKYFEQGIVEMAPDGDVLKLNFDKWNQADIMDFAAALNRHADQVVQRAQRGETSSWMHKDVGALLMHLKSFTVLAMQKQLLRNARIMDAEATMGFLYSMASAGAVYSAQQVISGREQNLTPEKIMKGSITLSNMTGWLPQWTDPVASMLGMDNLRFSHYGAQGVGGDVIGAPPVLSTMNRIAHIPEATVGLVTGKYKNEDISALQATPIIGNLYGFSYIFNKMKQDLKDEAKSKKKAPKPAKPAAPKPKSDAATIKEVQNTEAAPDQADPLQKILSK